MSGVRIPPRPLFQTAHEPHYPAAAGLENRNDLVPTVDPHVMDQGLDKTLLSLGTLRFRASCELTYVLYRFIISYGVIP
jgi:hypothetical protein